MTLTVICAFLHKMISPGQSVLVPLNVRGMKVLDREKFSRKIKVPVLKVKEKHLAHLVPYCRPHFLKQPNIKPIQNEEGESTKKCLLLNPDKITQWEDITNVLCHDLSPYEISEEDLTTKEIQFSYENWSFDTIFKAVLPEGEDIISSYSQIGHVLHLNLKDHLYDYRHLIGKVLLDKIKTCRTVVNKVNSIDNTFRNFKMEVIAGEEDFHVTVKENRCSFDFDFSKVYWNPRLGKEHERILSYLSKDDVLFDVFCGVGPFSVPASKYGCRVYANDLNPDCFFWLNHNANRNKANKNNFRAYNMDGKDFILTVFKQFLVEVCHNKERFYGNKICVAMNLPALAIEFLKYFKSLLKDEVKYKDDFHAEIIVYLYCFAAVDGENNQAVVTKMVNEEMGFDMTPYILNIFDVRNVSPKKEMLRVTITLSKDILFGQIKSNEVEEPPSKKLCTKMIE